MAEAILYADLAAAALTANAKLRSAESAIQILCTLRRTARGTQRHTVFIDLIDDQTNKIGKQSDEAPIERR